jgi:predicted phage terminase large subunit-like protein
MAKAKRQVFAPASEKQRLILTAQEDIVLVGGGAGGGKSISCLMKNLDSINDPDMKVTICRKTRPELTRQGGLVSESKKMYEAFGATFNKTDLKWEFPLGGEIQFLGVPDASMLGGIQGMQASRILIDEVADDWEEEVVLFLLSRLRANATKREQLFMTCNPNPSSFLVNWLEYCLDSDGVPRKGTENRVRWMIALDGKVYWEDSPKALYERYGKPKGKTYGLDLSPEDLLSIHPDKLFIPKSFRFIPCNVYDNPYLLPPLNTSYLANLLAQSKKNQLKFLHGSWKNIDIGQSHFRRDWCEVVGPEEVPDHAKRVRAYDLAATPVSEVNKNPDFTAGVLMSRDKFGIYYIEDLVKYRERPHTVLANIIKQSEMDGKHVRISIPKDTGSGGAIAAQHFITTLSEAGCIVKALVKSGHNSKLNSGLPFCQIAEAGNVKIVRGDWNEEFFDDMEAFLGTPETLRKIKDDTWDAVSDGFKCLVQDATLPSFALPDMAKSSVIPA